MPSEDNIAKLTQENAELREEISVLKRRKKFGLVWEDKPEEVVDRCQSELPVLQEVKKLAIGNDDNLQTNLLIEGDNFHALSVLNYTHAGKIDVIYIDPPYNTGAKDWKYNNDYVDKADGYRHSKWLSMMASRLDLAKNLLSENGFICVAIDHNELFTLGCLLDDIFGEDKRLGVVTVVHQLRGGNMDKNFSTSNEFVLVYSRDNGAKIQNAVIDPEKQKKFNLEDSKSKYYLKNCIVVQGGAGGVTRQDKPNYWYPIYVSENLKHVSLQEKRGYEAVYPIARRELTWVTKADTFMQRWKEGEIVIKREGTKINIYRKFREQQIITTCWIAPKYNATSHGTLLLEKIIGKGKFNYPKSVWAVLDFLKITSKKDSIILDFFAGSGTTGHAVSLLNKEDGGNRQYILCTNNENGIARDVCQPRVKAVIKGHPDLPDLTGVPSNLKYYKTDFVPSVPTDSNKYKLTVRATEMLCVRENTFIECRVTKTYKIYRSQNRYTGIIYDAAVIERFKRVIARIDGVFNVYVFSFGDHDFAEEFADMHGKVNSQPIPEGILETYRSVFTKGSPR